MAKRLNLFFLSLCFLSSPFIFYVYLGFLVFLGGGRTSPPPPLNPPVKTSLPCLHVFLSQLFGCQMHFVYRSKLVLCITKTAVFGSPFVACLGRYAKADSNIKYFGVAWGIKGGSRIHLCIRKYFDFSQHVVFTICILFTTLLTKTQGMCEWASKQTLDLRILPRRDRAPSF